MPLGNSIRARLAHLESIRAQKKVSLSLEKYARDPVGYCHDILKIGLWQAQIDAAEALLKPPYRVNFRSANSIGKSYVGAALISWFFDTHPRHCKVLTTAPTEKSVKDILWAEVRTQRKRVGLSGFTGPSMPEMRTSDDHVAMGYTSKNVEAFHGRHPEFLFLLYDEATGIEPEIFAGGNSMFQPNGKHCWLNLYNPLDTSSQVYAEEMATNAAGEPIWKTIEVSALDHPNLIAGLQGLEEPYPGAVSVAQWIDWMGTYGCDPIRPEDRGIYDFEWPPKSGNFFRPGSELEARGLGRWPRQGMNSVWSDEAWSAAIAPREFTPSIDLLPIISCDSALSGEDFTVIMVRWGIHALHHERHNGWLHNQTANRLKELAAYWAIKASELRQVTSAKVKPEEIPIHIDGDGAGADLLDHRGGYRFISICGTSRAKQGRYFNRRSELWFTGPELARNGRMCLAKLDYKVRHLLRTQAMAPQWAINGVGQKVVEPKERTKKRIKGASPDDMDSLNLLYTDVQYNVTGTILPPPPGYSH